MNTGNTENMSAQQIYAIVFISAALPLYLFATNARSPSSYLIAEVCDNAKVYDNAFIGENAKVFGNACVYKNAQVPE